MWTAIEWKWYMNHGSVIPSTRMERRLVREFESNETRFWNRHFECVVSGSDDTQFFFHLRPHFRFWFFIHPFQVLSFDKQHKYWRCKLHCIQYLYYTQIIFFYLWSFVLWAVYKPPKKHTEMRLNAGNAPQHCAEFFRGPSVDRSITVYFGW